MSIAEPGKTRLDRADVAALFGLALAAFSVYGATHAGSLSGLFPPDVPPPRELEEPRLLEYLRRASGVAGSWVLSSAAAAATVALCYRIARALGARPAASAAASLALAFGRGFWQQAVLPGIDSVLPLPAAAGLAALAGRRAPSRVRVGAAVAGLLLSVGIPHTLSPLDPEAAGRWLFVELNAAGLALAIAGAVVVARHRDPFLAIVAGTLVLTVIRGASSPHAALLPVFAVLGPLVAVGASTLASWLAPRRPVWLLLIPLVPLLGNVRHVVSEPDREPRRRLDAFAEHVGRCDAIIGQRNASTPLLPTSVPADRSPGCAVLALTEARAALEHVGHRFETIGLAGDTSAHAFDLSRLSGRADCTTLTASSWTDVSRLTAAGRIGVLLTGPTPSGGIVVYAGREQPLDPWMPVSWTVIGPGLDHRSLPSDGAARAASLRDDAVDLEAVASVPSLHRIAVNGGTSTGTSMLMSLDFGGIPSVALARATGAVRQATVCAATRGRNLFDLPGVTHEVIRGGRSFFGAGWGSIERHRDRDWRPLTAVDGELLLPLSRPSSMEVVMTAAPAPAGGGSVAIRVNGRQFRRHALDNEVAEHRWTVPADAWKTGVNQLLVQATPAVLIAQVELRRTTKPTKP